MNEKTVINTPRSSNFHRSRIKSGMSLPGLTEISGIGKNALSELENGSHAASISTVWQLAKAMSFGDLVDHAASDASHNDGLTVRLVDKQSEPRVIESYLMNLAPRASRRAESHGPGVTEHIVMLKGAMLTGACISPVLVSAGQPYSFNADVAHIYQSLDQPAIAMVTVIYPEIELCANHFDVQKIWPRHDDQWQGMRMQLARCQLEVAQGISAFRIRFEECELTAEQAMAELSYRLTESEFMSPICNFILFDGLPSIIGFQRPHGHATLFPSQNNFAVLGQAIPLVNHCVAPAHILSGEEISALEKQTKSDTLVLATLAAETLTRHGMPCVPAYMVPKPEIPKPKNASPAYATFEDRIDVSAYASYELLHPAYAKQSVAIAQAISEFDSTGRLRLLEIGTGPGTSLQLLLEMIPTLEVVAVEPSAVAFAYLSKLFKGDERVLVDSSSITEVTGKYDAFDIAVSVGASHHLNTSDFLQSAHGNLKQNALFIVADEMIAPFDTVLQRQKNLIVHHLQYVADTLVPINTGTISDAEHSLVDGMQKEIPLALYEAHAGLAEASALRCRRLLSNLNSLIFPQVLSHPLLAFYRFHYLELEALVAGLDYEVEQKTYPSRFLDLALHARFELIKHSRLYATHGDSEWDAGTHFFILKKLP